MSRRFQLAHASYLLAGFALTLAGCNNDSMGSGGAPPQNTAPLTQAEARAVAEEMRGEVAGMTNGVSLEDLMVPQALVPVEAGAVFRGPIAFTNPVDCPSFSEFPPTDLDHDRIPDDLLITFDSTKCTFGGSRGHAKFTINGTIHIVDPSQTDKAFRIEFGDLVHKFVVEDTLFWLRRVDGAFQVLTSNAGFSLIDSTTVGRESSNRPSAELKKQWRAEFTVTAAAGFAVHTRLPSGDLTVNGSTERTHDSDTKIFAVETVTPLHFDATCMADDRIVSGELNVTYTRDAGVTMVNIKWDGCGVDPVVTVTPPPTAT